MPEYPSLYWNCTFKRNTFCARMALGQTWWIQMIQLINGIWSWDSESLWKVLAYKDIRFGDKVRSDTDQNRVCHFDPLLLIYYVARRPVGATLVYYFYQNLPWWTLVIFSRPQCLWPMVGPFRWAAHPLFHLQRLWRVAGKGFAHQPLRRWLECGPAQRSTRCHCSYAAYRCGSVPDK